MVTHAKRSSRRPWVHVNIRGLHALKPNMTRNCSRSRHRSREAGGIGDMGPCSDTLVPDQSIHRNRPLAPILPHRPCESCHHKGSRWASSGGSIGHRHCTGQRGDIVVQKNTRTKEQNKQPSCRWAICRFSRGSVNQTRHRRAVLATLAETTEKQEPNCQGVGNSHCLGHMFNLAK